MRLSIITVNYNNNEGLKATIDSVLRQTFNDYEFIIMDGGSADGSKDTILNFQKYIDYWKSESDEGIYNAMNKSIFIAKGDYCLFINSGDLIYDRSTLQNIFSEYTESSYDFLVGDTILTEKRKNKLLKSPASIDGKFLLSGSCCHQSTFIKTELLKNRPYREDLKIISDWEQMFHELIFNNCSYKKLNHIISIYNTEGVSSTNWKKAYEERDKVINEVLPPRIQEDYEVLLYGKTYLEMVLSRINKKSITYLTLTGIALIFWCFIKTQRVIKSFFNKLWPQ